MKMCLIKMNNDVSEDNNAECTGCREQYETTKKARRLDPVSTLQKMVL